jgi:hypothetical protein
MIVIWAMIVIEAMIVTSAPPARPAAGARR